MRLPHRRFLGLGPRLLERRKDGEEESRLRRLVKKNPGGSHGVVEDLGFVETDGGCGIAWWRGDGLEFVETEGRGLGCGGRRGSHGRQRMQPCRGRGRGLTETERSGSGIGRADG